jgi:autotransporter strand-loop-strand O-heptosyltransferase
MTTTAGCKEWSHDGGWQKLINNLKDLGYEIAIIQKEPVNPNINGILDWTGDYPLEVRMNQLYHSEFYIGLGSGLSWLAWAMNKHVVMIANFSEDGHEFTNNTTRITNTFVCNSCWNNPKFKFDKGDWYWCPEHKGTDRQFECHKSITPEMVINQIQHLL